MRRPRYDPETTLVAWWDPREPAPGGRGDLMYGYPRRPDGRLLDLAFTGVRLDIPRDDKRSLSFIEELEDRGYDLTTLRFSIRLKEPPKAPHVTAVEPCPHGCVGACTLCAST